MKPLDKMLKSELITLIHQRNREVELLRTKLSEAHAPRRSHPSFVPKEVVESYFAAHPEMQSKVVPKDVLLSWAYTNGVMTK